MADPFLDLFQVGVVFQRVGDRRRAQRVRPEAVDIDADHAGVPGQNPVQTIGRDRADSARVVAHGAEQWRRLVVAVPGRLKVGADGVGRRRMQRHVADLAALAEHAQVAYAASIVQIDQVQRAQLGAAQAVIQQGGEHGAVAQAPGRRAVRRREQRARLVVADRRRRSFLAGHLRAFDAIDGIAGHRVGLAQRLKQRRERRQFAPDRRAAKGAQLQVAAPGQHVGAADLAKRVRVIDAGERHEFPHIVFVGAARLRVVDVGEPGQRRRHVGQLVELHGAQGTVDGGGRWDQVGHGLFVFVRRVGR